MEGFLLFILLKLTHKSSLEILQIKVLRRNEDAIEI